MSYSFQKLLFKIKDSFWETSYLNLNTKIIAKPLLSSNNKTFAWTKNSFQLLRIPQIGEWLIWLLATFISKFIKVATKCYDIIPQEVYIPSMWNFMAGRRDPALSSLWNRYSHLETIPQHNEFEAEIMVCEISQYLSTKTSSSGRFFYNMEL